MSNPADRKEILRKPCPDCRENGFIVVNGDEQPCTRCDMSGFMEKEVPYKFDGPRSKEEIDAEFAE